MVTPESQIITLALWLLVIKFSQISVYPYLKPALKDLSYGLAYPISALLLALISWFTAMAGIPVQCVLIFFAVLFAFAFYKKQYELNELKKQFIYDVIFLSAFSLLLIVRWFNPGIVLTGEKFMDSAFLSSIMINPTVIPNDPWLSGADLSIYYYLGHWMFGVLGVIALGASSVVFNLMLPTVFAFAAVSAYAIGVLLLNHHRWLPMLVLIIPNTALLIESFSGRSLTEIWWNSTRVIGENSATINEYPLFSFLWGDPHAHLLACFNQILFICLLTVMLVRWKDLETYGKYLLAVLISISLGVMPAMNSWDVMIYSAAYLLIAFIVWFRNYSHKINIKELIPLILVPFLSILTASPFLISLITSGSSSTSGIAFVTTPSALIEFLMVWGFFIAVFIIDGFSNLKKYPWIAAVPVLFFLIGYGSLGLVIFCILLIILKKNLHPENIFAVIGLLVLALMEIIYIKDFFDGTEYYRMNTVFKFGFDSWIILGISALTVIGRWFKNLCLNLKPKIRFSTAAVMFVILAVLLVNFGISSGYSGGTLDGSAWLKSEHPDDYAGINYLIDNAEPSDIIVEASGSSYRYNSRVSVFTGLPSVIGWSSHEQGWRCGIINTSERLNDIKQIYENPSKSLDLLNKYNVRYIYAAELENKLYDVNLPSECLKLVFESDGAAIYQKVC